MGNICEVFSKRERKQEQSHIATPGYLGEVTDNILKNIPLQQYSVVIDHYTNRY